MSLKALLLAALVGTIPATSFGQSHRLVDIGSHRLDVVCAGAGSPAVILEAGLGNGLDDWDPIWPSLAQFSTVDPSYPGAFRAYYDSVLKSLKPGAEAEEIRETLRIQAAGGTDGLRPLPDIPIAVLTSMRVDPKAKSVNMTARGHELWREMHDEWFRRSHNGIHLVTTRSGHAIQAQEPELVVEAIRFVLDRVRTQ